MLVALYRRWYQGGMIDNLCPGAASGQGDQVLGAEGDPTDSLHAQALGLQTPTPSAEAPR